jgi:hypothetical protein
MQHLNIEDLARLVDEEPTAAETAHITTCRQCTEELEELRAQTGALADLPDRAPPSAEWAILRSRLASEGLITTASARHTGTRTLLLRIAAALAIFAAGSVTGAFLRAAPAGPNGATATSPPTAQAALAAATPGEAGAQLQEAEQLYLAALTRYAELTLTGEEIDPITRLAALEGIVLTAQAALREAPADPVINGYLLTAMGQREAMLRQISRSPDQDWF